jgi:hypothetical protein
MAINGGIIPAETGQYIDPLTEGDYVVTVTTDGCTSESLPYTFIADGIFSSSWNSAIYPNPTMDVVHLEFVGQFDFVLYDLRGQICANGQGENEVVLSLNHLASGVYQVTLTNDAQSVSRLVEKL